MGREFKIENLSWTNISFLVSTPLLAIAGLIYYFYNYNFSWGLLALFFAMYILTGMAITGGYHRLFAHKSYKADAWLRLLYLCFGAAAFQNSAMKWCADHRRHHAKVDTSSDPYSINEGFWHAHLFWIFFKSDNRFSKECPDLKKDALVVWQDKYYVAIAVAFGFLLPTVVGYFMGNRVAKSHFCGWVRDCRRHCFLCHLGLL